MNTIYKRMNDKESIGGDWLGVDRAIKKRINICTSNFNRHYTKTVPTTKHYLNSSPGDEVVNFDSPVLKLLKLQGNNDAVIMQKPVLEHWLRKNKLKNKF